MRAFERRVMFVVTTTASQNILTILTTALVPLYNGRRKVNAKKFRMSQKYVSNWKSRAFIKALLHDNPYFATYN